MQAVFIISSPRSGSTFLCDLLGRHPLISGWHEPYFIWQFYVPRKKDDVLRAHDVNPKIKRFVEKQFRVFAENKNTSIIIEKTPVNAFKINFINSLFPDAKWIHLYRDGRDVVSSITLKMRRREKMMKTYNVFEFMKDVNYTIKRQPILYHRILALIYEIKTLDHLRDYFAKEYITFGPRYPGWRHDLGMLEPIEFAAKQWVECEKFIAEDLEIIRTDNILSISYEDLVTRPAQLVEKLCQFINVPHEPLEPFFETITNTNLNKWKYFLSDQDLNTIAPLINNTLHRLGYNKILTKKGT